MTLDTEVVSARLPVLLVDKIDEIISKLGFSSTRPVYIVRAMDVFFRDLVSARLNIDSQVESLKKIQDIDPNTILSITKAAVEIYLKKYEQYSGEKQQILIRVPKKMLEKIDSYSTDIGLYENRADFIRFAVANQVENDLNLLEKMERVRNHKVIQKRTTEEIVNSVLNKLQSPDSESLYDLVDLATKFIAESKKEK